MKKQFDERIYSSISLTKLIILAINEIVSNREECAYERVVKECFTLFPRAFCFDSYRDWPDSRRLDRPLRWLRKEKIVVGDPKTSFTLTKLGKEKAIIIEKRLRQKKLNLF